MNITIRQFRAFLAVADLRCFAAAGNYLCITQGAVSGL
ncbi:LysR family transcriptional regulator, partial [Salmonella enterica]